ncbi:MAG: phage integrase N-terminal SAM-like domain-containing protein [Ideonella sp.]|nr:phage integrase N-terminal SAM-like domain-containing protein [Ideonella sp.]
MDTTTRTGTPLRQRMTEDMRMRKLEDKTQQAYIRAVRKLTVYLERAPDTATVEDLRNFQLHLVDSGHVADHPERHAVRAEVLLRHHAGPCRVDGPDAAGGCRARCPWF